MTKILLLRQNWCRNVVIQIRGGTWCIVVCGAVVCGGVVCGGMVCGAVVCGGVVCGGVVCGGMVQCFVLSWWYALHNIAPQWKINNNLDLQVTLP